MAQGPDSPESPWEPGIEWRADDHPNWPQPVGDPATGSHGMLTPRWEPSQGPAPTFESQQYLTPRISERRTWITYLVLAALVLFVVWQILARL